MKDIVVALCLVASIPICLRWPWVGGVVWGWLGFLYPHRVTEGLVLDVPFVWLVVAATLVGLARTRPRYPLPRSREMILLLGLWAFCGLTTVVAVYPDRAWPRWFELSRILSLLLVVVALFQEGSKLKALMWTTALALASYAAYGAVWVLVTGGVSPLYGPHASDIENNNDLGAALVTMLPFLVFLGHSASPRWVPQGTLVLFAATVVAVLGTYSRGAMLALAAVLVALALFRQWRAVIAAGIAWAVFLTCTNPQTWLDRAASIRSYQEDPTASMRPLEWYVAFHLGLDHPILGAGFRPFTTEVYERYIPGYSSDRDAHNLFLQVFAEHGLPGLALYAALLGSTLVTLWRISRRPAADPEDGWMRDAARMLQVGLLGYIVDGMFQCLSYRALFFDLLALSIMLDALARAPGHVIAPIPSEAPGAPSRRSAFARVLRMPRAQRR